MSPTPSYAAALPAGDEPDAHLDTRTAVSVILGAYLTFFLGGIIRAIQLRDQVIGPIDYSTPASIAVLGRLLGEMGGAALLLYLVCQWLAIARPMAGIPRRGASTVPSLLTTAAAFGGLIVSTMVLAALHPAPDPNALAGGALRNNWTVPGAVIDSLHAGVVEEVVIVAIPVLIGRRAGWHPAVIAALSMFLRWPFHIYHGTWSSLPWAAIWGGTHVLAYLYLRRLAPLVLFHTLQDFIPSMTDTQHGILAIAVGAAYVLLLISHLDRGVRDSLRRSAAAAAAADRDPAAVEFLARRQVKAYRRTAALVTLFWAATTWFAVNLLHVAGAVAAGGVAVGFAVLVAVTHRIARKLGAGQNVRAYRTTGTDTVDAVAAWSISYTGRVALSITKTNRRTPPQVELNAVRDIAAATQQTLTVLPSRDAYQLITAQLHLGRRTLTRRILITPVQAAQLG